MGRKALSKKHRRELAAGRLWTEESAPKRGFLRAWGTFVVRRPRRSLAAGAAVLIVVALPFLSMKTAFNIPGGADPESTERTAYNLIVEEFGGVQSPLIVLAEGDDVASSTGALQETLAELPGVAMVTPAEIGASGDIARVTIIPTGGPIEESTKNLVHELRDQGETMVPGLTLEITGETAIGIDRTPP